MDITLIKILLSIFIPLTLVAIIGIIIIYKTAVKQDM